MLPALGGTDPFPGATVDVALLAISRTPPVRLPNGVEPEELLQLDSCPLDPSIAPGEVERVETIRAESIQLGDVAEIDTGVVSHGPGTASEISSSTSRVTGEFPTSMQQDLIEGRVRWLAYRPIGCIARSGRAVRGTQGPGAASARRWPHSRLDRSHREVRRSHA
jgi:hypothetical protein